MAELYSRHLNLEQVINFRDLGGYRTRDGRIVAWRRVFRSGELARMNKSDYKRLTREIALNSIIDLRSPAETREHQPTPLATAGVKYHNIPFFTGEGSRQEDDHLFSEISNMGEFYLYVIRRREFGRKILAALEVIAMPENHPLVFYCAVGKDRTGILAAILLGTLGVADEDVISDYCLSGPYVEEFLSGLSETPRMAMFPEHLPEFFWKASPESMALFLATLTEEYGSVRGYLQDQGAGASLVNRLEKALLD